MQGLKLGVKVGVLEFSKEKLLVTSIEGTTGKMKEVEGEEAREGDEGKVIAMEEIIVLDEGTRGI